MGPKTRAPDRALLASFVAVILSFAAATWYSQYRAEAIDAVAGDIATNAAPSIEHLAAARTEVRRLQAAAADAVASPEDERPARLGELAQARVSLLAEVGAYERLPFFPGERERWRRSVADLDALTANAAAVESALRSGSTEAARRIVVGPLRLSVELTNASLLRAIDFDAREAQQLALRIERVRERSSRMAFGLDLLCAAFSLLAAVMTWRSVRRHAELTEAHLRMTEGRAEELELFAGRVAHDILNPIGAAAMGMDLAWRYAADNARAQDALTRGRLSLTRASQIVSGLLEFARAGARPVPGARADVRQVMEDLLQELKPAAVEVGAELSVNVVPACVAACSPGCLSSLVSNLARNAIKYIGDGPVRRIQLRVLLHGGSVRVEVEDTGPGLPPGLVKSCFEPYVRAPNTGKPGIGLGLATVKRIAEAHGGQVGVRSAPGKGCLFWFEVPALASELDRADVSPLTH